MIRKVSYFGIVATLSLLIFFTSYLSQCSSPKESNSSREFEPVSIEEKQRGVHLFSYMDTMTLKDLSSKNFEWITLVPFGNQDKYDSPRMRFYNQDSLAIIQHQEGWIKQIDAAQDAGFKVFYKPHIWINDDTSGKWRSDVFPQNDENWDLWKEDYRSFVLRYAKIAEAAGAEMYCVGTELSRLTMEKPQYWIDLIHDVRKVYSGKLTYASNWYKEFESISFWNHLDYIGIQAYFPLVKNEYPSVEEIEGGWKKYMSVLNSVHADYGKNILFTELGYKSTSDSGIKPWEWIDYNSGNDKSFSLETQANCYLAFFNSIWDQDWFAGAHIWQWRGDYKGWVGKDSLDFTPRGKPAEKIIVKGFQK